MGRIVCAASTPLNSASSGVWSRAEGNKDSDHIPHMTAWALQIGHTPLLHLLPYSTGQPEIQYEQAHIHLQVRPSSLEEIRPFTKRKLSQNHQHCEIYVTFFF